MLSMSPSTVFLPPSTLFLPDQAATEAAGRRLGRAALSRFIRSSRSSGSEGDPRAPGESRTGPNRPDVDESRPRSGCDVVFFCGELGAGKTTLARGFLRGLGFVGPVKSPTYTIVEGYEIAGVTIYHLDLYRIGHADELEFIGVREYLDDGDFCLVEWPERGAGVLSGPDLVARISSEAHGRRLSLAGSTARGDGWLRDWISEIP